jgi:NAD(P)-dependent dehydrogenase (short-subunit alcohol dehydrogenase family)
MVDFNPSKALMNRMSRPEEIAHLAHFLASDEFSFIRRISVRIDGGKSVKV